MAMGAALCFFLATLLFSRRNRCPSDPILGWFFAVNGCFFSSALLAEAQTNPDWLLVLWNSSLLDGPLLFLYVATLIDRQGKRPPKTGVHFVPYAVSWIVLGTLLLFVPEDLMERYLTWGGDPGTPLILKLFLWLETLALPLYLSGIGILLLRHSSAVSEEYSFREQVDLRWLRVLVSGAGVGWLLVEVPYRLGPRIGLHTEAGAVNAGFAVSAGVVFFLGYFGIRQGTIFVPNMGSQSGDPFSGPSNPSLHSSVSKHASVSKHGSASKYARSGLTEEERDELAQKVRDHMVQSQAFRNPTLSLSGLSADLSLSSHDLSRVINEGLGVSFFDFVNGFRVNAVRDALREGRSGSILTLAFDAGFNSKASFNRVFKRLTGVTPTQYQRNLSGSGSVQSESS